MHKKILFCIFNPKIDKKTKPQSVNFFIRKLATQKKAEKNRNANAIKTFQSNLL